MSIIERILKYLNLARVSSTEAIIHVPQLSGRWERVIDENDAVLGFQFHCLCGQKNKYKPQEALVDQIHRCICGRDFNLKKSLTLTGADTTLVKRSEPQRLIRTVGDENVPLYWSGKTDAAAAARDRAFASGDPADMGPGFGEPRH